MKHEDKRGRAALEKIMAEKMSICENHKHISKKFKEFTYNKDKKHHRFLLKRSAKPEDNKMFYVTLLGEQSWKLVFCFLQTLSMDF